MKSAINPAVTATAIVTPFLGVWIEIHLYGILSKMGSVTPFLGVWIEIYETSIIPDAVWRSLPSWECGLK